MISNHALSVVFLLVIAFASGCGAHAAPSKDDSPATAGETSKLIAQLGDDKFCVRDAATKRLIEIGMPALELLLEAKRQAEPETRRRAEIIIEAIGAA